MALVPRMIGEWHRPIKGAGALPKGSAALLISRVKIGQNLSGSLCHETNSSDQRAGLTPPGAAFITHIRFARRSPW